MAFTPSFACAQSPTTFNIVVVSDTSTGADAAITQRRVYVETSTGTFLVNSGVTTDYTPWALSSATINLNILTQSTACTITVEWLDVSNNVLYTSTSTFCFRYYLNAFGYYLTQLIAATPNIIQDTNFFNNYTKFWSLLKGAINAIDFAGDVANSQEQLNMATYMQNNQSLYF